MILTDREIQLALFKEQIAIEPKPALIAYSSTSVDLTLDARLTIIKEDLDEEAIETSFDPAGPKKFVAERAIAKLSNEHIIGEEGYLLRTHKLILGWTAEQVRIPIHARLAARVEGKSSLARIGLGVHITAPTIHSGFSDPIRLEMVNQGKVPIRLRKGMRICQLVFELTLGTPEKGFAAIQTGS